MFRYKRSVKLPYDRQGYIYYLSRQYKALPKERQKRIEELCAFAGGEYREALLDFVTTDRGAVAICMRHNISESTLNRAVRKYYMSFPQDL